MSRDEFFRRLYKAFEDTDVEWKTDDCREAYAAEGEVYVQFTNVEEYDE